MLHQEGQAALFEAGLQQPGGGAVELAVQQRCTQMHDRHFHAACRQAVGGFQPQQAAADDDRMPEPCGSVYHEIDVANIAKGNDALQVMAGNGQDKRIGAGGQQQAVVLGQGAVVGVHFFAAAVYAGDCAIKKKTDIVFFVPAKVVQHDVLNGLFTRQYRRQQNPVVVGIGLRAEHGNVIQIRIQLDQFFHRSDAGHAVADNDEFQFFHHALTEEGCSEVAWFGIMPWSPAVPALGWRWR